INAHTHAGPGPISRGLAEDLALPAGTPFYVSLTRLYQVAYSEPLREAYRDVVRWDVYAMLRSGTTTILTQNSTDIEGYFDIASELGARTYGGPILPLNVAHRLGTIQNGVVSRTDQAADQEAELDAHRALFRQYDGSAQGRIRLVLG